MHIVRSRGWLLMVLVFVVVAVAWTTADAGTRPGSPTEASSCISGSRPAATPTAGEPDATTTPKPVTKTGLVTPDPRGGDDGWLRGHSINSWFRWIIRDWTVRYLGAR